MTEVGMRDAADARHARDLDAVLADLRRSYNAPPVPPLELMWDRIEHARAGVVGTVVPGPRATGWSRARAWFGMAAALLFGVALGRVSAAAESEGGERRTDGGSLLSIQKAGQHDAFGRRAGDPLAPCELPAEEPPRGNVDN